MTDLSEWYGEEILLSLFIVLFGFPIFHGLVVALFPKGFSCLSCYCRYFKEGRCKQRYYHKICMEELVISMHDVTLEVPGNCWGNIEIQGYLKPPALGQPVIICVHGIFGSFDFIMKGTCLQKFRYDDRNELTPFLEGDYGVFGIDLRNHGLSSCTVPTGLGSLEYQEVLQAVEYINESFPTSPIVLYCHSMGAASSLLALNYTDAVSGIVILSGLYSINGALFRNFRRCLCCCPMFYLNYLVLWMKAIIFLFSFTWVEDPHPPSVPMLQFHNTVDPTIPFQQAKEFSEIQSTELVTYKHTCYHLSAHEAVDDFHERVVAFLSKVCGDQPMSSI